METKVPQKLFICLLKTRYGEEGWEKLPSKEHRPYMSDLWRKGIFFAGGPSADKKTGIEVFSVDTLEEAKEAMRNAPNYKSGFLYEDKYLEWHPKHWPPAIPGINPSSGRKD